MSSENMDDDYEENQYNAFQCDSCEQWSLVEPENTRLIFFDRPNYVVLFVGECTTGGCESRSYRFVPVDKLAHFEFIDWAEHQDTPEQSVKEAWHRTIGRDIDQKVGKFTIELEHLEPFDFRD